MSVPKGLIWQSLRTDCLDAIPLGSRVNILRPVCLADWQLSGYYRVVDTKSNHFELEASSDDFGSALLTDAEHLFDSAAEHQVSLWKNINSSEWTSPAWLAVTLYYWSFFLALAITRLTGRTAWYLPSDRVKRFKTLGPAAPRSPGAGCFRLVCGPRFSVTERKIRVEKRDVRIHEEIWKIWLGLCDDRMAATAGQSNVNETRLYAALKKSSDHLGRDWPSVFRSAVNYRAGFAYTAVRKAPVLKSLAYLRQPRTYGILEILDRLERNLGSIRKREDIDTKPQNVLEILVDFTFCVYALATELHLDLLERHGLDKRWKQKRIAFMRCNAAGESGSFWPI